LHGGGAALVILTSCGAAGRRRDATGLGLLGTSSPSLLEGAIVHWQHAKNDYLGHC